MSLFSWLFIGHLIGDWLLQNDQMARDKQSAILSRQCILHCSIYSLSIAIILWYVSPQLPDQSSYFIFLFTIFVSHWLIDAFQLAARWGRWFKQSDTLFVRVVVDQTFHLIILALLIETVLT